MPVNPDPWLPADTSLPGIPAVPIVVYRYTNAGQEGANLFPLPNVQWLVTKKVEGPNPAVATFRYDFTTGLSGAPSNLEEALDKSFTGAYTVDPGWRLCVRATRYDGTPVWLFDGIVLDFGGVWGRGHEEVTIIAHGWTKMLFNVPLPGALIRASGTPTTPNTEYQTDRLALPNERGAANCTPKTFDSESDDASPGEDLNYPAFLDPAVYIAVPDSDRIWTLPRLARLLLFKYADWTIINNFPDGPTLDALLVSKVPLNTTAFDPNNAATYMALDIAVSDAPLNGRYWPTYLYDQIAPHGFGMDYVLGSDGAGFPRWTLNLFCRIAQPVKQVYLQPRNTVVDPWSSNLEHIQVGRNLEDVVNQFHVQGGLIRYEITAVLAPAFPMITADATAANMKKFISGTDDFDSGLNSVAYRDFIFGEGGDDWYTISGSTPHHDPPDLSSVFGKTDGVNNYGDHRRKPLRDLLTLGGDNKPLKAKLWISPDYTGDYPALWDHDLDNEFKWFEVEKGWELLKDRVGIRITNQDPNQWKVWDTETKHATAPPSSWAGGTIKAIEALANPSTRNPSFILSLTCVIEADKACHYLAAQTPNSALPYAVTRYVDGRDRYRQEIIAACSDLNDTGAEIVSRDDTGLMQAEATAYQLNSEAGVMDCDPVILPYITDYYKIGDRISGVNGRAFSFRTDNGGNSWQPTLPSVVGIQWEGGTQQRTILSLSDRGLDRHGRSTRKSQAKTQAALAHTSQRHHGTGSALPAVMARGKALGAGGDSGVQHGHSPIDYSQGGMIRTPQLGEEFWNPPPPGAPASGLGGGLSGGGGSILMFGSDVGTPTNPGLMSVPPTGPEQQGQVVMGPPKPPHLRSGPESPYARAGPPGSPEDLGFNDEPLIGGE